LNVGREIGHADERCPKRIIRKMDDRSGPGAAQSGENIRQSRESAIVADGVIEIVHEDGAPGPRLAAAE